MFIPKETPPPRGNHGHAGAITHTDGDQPSLSGVDFVKNTQDDALTLSGSSRASRVGSGCNSESPVLFCAAK